MLRSPDWVALISKASHLEGGPLSGTTQLPYRNRNASIDAASPAIQQLRRDDRVPPQQALTPQTIIADFNTQNWLITPTVHPTVQTSPEIPLNNGIWFKSPTWLVVLSGVAVANFTGVGGTEYTILNLSRRNRADQLGGHHLRLAEATGRHSVAWG